MMLDIHAVNPYIRIATPSVISAGRSIKRRVLFDYELIYVESGTFVLNYAGRDYVCSQGQFVLLRPGVPHCFSGIETDVSQPHIHFDMVYTDQSPHIPISFRDIGEFSAQERCWIQEDVFTPYPQEPFVACADIGKFLELFYGVLREPEGAQLTRKAKLLQMMEMLAAENFPNCFSAVAYQHDIAQQLKAYMDAEQGLSAQLEELEKQFSYSRYYLERQFKKAYGTGLIAYRNRKRMQLAARLLPGKTVSYVSEKTGYSSIYAFSRAFKQHFGLCPTEFKQQNNHK